MPVKITSWGVATTLAIGLGGAAVAEPKPAADIWAGVDFDAAPAQAAAFDLSAPIADWTPAPMADDIAYAVDVDGRGRRVRAEEPGVVGAALGEVKTRLLRPMR